MMFHEGADEAIVDSNAKERSLSSVLIEGPPSRNAMNMFNVEGDRSRERAPYDCHSHLPLLSSDEVGWGLERWSNRPCIDYMAMSFPVTDMYRDPPLPWKGSMIGESPKSGHKFKVQFPLMEDQVFLQVSRTATGLYGYVNFNPTSLLHGRNSAFSVGLDEALGILPQIEDAVNHFVKVVPPIGEWKMSRLDVNHTIGPVVDVQRIMKIAQAHPFNNQVKVQTFGTRKGIETVTCRSKKSGGFCVYDKGKQGKFNVSLVRFEIRAKQHLLKQKCPTVADVTDAICQELFNHFLGGIIEALQHTPRTVIDDIMANRRDAQVLIEMLGIYVLKEKGHSFTPSPYVLRNKYQPLMRNYNIREISEIFAT